MPAATWRLIVETEPGDGAWNMALDRAIQIVRSRNRVPPTLRIYRWRRSTVTIGRFQDAECLDWGACRRFGVEAVRRFTGGRGVLHDDEITYSLIASLADGVPRGVAASYRHFCVALVEAYRRMGVDAALAECSRASARSAACYLSRSEADLSVGALKLSGSAQTWLNGTVLQHGSFTLTRDIPREAAVFGLDSRAQEELAQTTATLQDCVGEIPSEAEICDAIVAGFREGLGVEFAAGASTAEEVTLAESFVDTVVVPECR